MIPSHMKSTAQAMTLRFLQYVIAPGACTELRIFGATFSQRGASIVRADRYSKTFSGWFDSPEAMLQTVASVREVSCYVTVNPVRPDLLGRADNRLKACPKGEGTNAGDILRRQFWYVDFDAMNPVGTSATRGELEPVLDRRAKFLDDHPEVAASSIWGGSGNGAWLLVRVEDLPADPQSYALIERALGVVAAKYADERVKIDTVNKDPSRVVCLPGTEKTKGENLVKGNPTTDRPWRLVTLESPGWDSAEFTPLSGLDLAHWVGQVAPGPAMVAGGLPEGRAGGLPLGPPKEGRARAGAAPWSGSGSRRDAPRDLILSWAAQNVDRMEPAVSGQGGHAKTFDMACSLVKGFNLTVAEALPIAQAYNARCQPPWSDEELRHKLESADSKVDSRPRGYLLDVCDRPGSASGAAQKGGDGPDKPIDEAGGKGKAGRFDHKYTDGNGFLARVTPAPKGGLEAEPIANFTARIQVEVSRHVSGRILKQYTIAAKHINGKTATIHVDADEFAKHGVGGALGADFAICAGMEKHARASIQILSSADGIRHKEIHCSTGWIEREGRWWYCHGAGLIGSDGPRGWSAVTEADGRQNYVRGGIDDIGVELDPALAKYCLPHPPLGFRDRKRAIRASLDIARLGRTNRPNARGIVAVGGSLPYRAVMRQSPGVVHFVGATGSRKTTFACLCVQHFAPNHSHDQPSPATWASTIHAIQLQLHEAKESLLLVDDLIADGPNAERERAKADGVFSSQGNAAGRRRMRQDLTLAAGMDSRGTLLSTGETSPGRRSALGRALVARFFAQTDDTLGTIDLDILSEIQADAAEGRFAEALAAYIMDVAGDLQGRLEQMDRIADEWRIVIADHAIGLHPRTAGIIAELGAAYTLFLDFAVREGAIDQGEADALAKEQRLGLMSLLADQAAAQEDADPGHRFLGLLRSALASGKVFLANQYGTAPLDRESACGWAQSDGHTWEPAMPASVKVGWVDDCHAYLDRNSTMAAVQRLASDQAEPLGEPNAVWARLAEVGHLIPATRGGKVRYDVRRVMEGSPRTVGMLLSSALWSDGEATEGEGKAEMDTEMDTMDTPY